MSERAAAFRLLSDQPDCGEEDPLGFQTLVDDLTSLVRGSRERTPFTLGVEGSWGSGKSTLLRRLEQSLRGQPGVVCVWFNAWTAERGDVLEGLIKSVLDELDPNILRSALRRKHVMTGLRLASTLVASWLRVGSLVDELWRRASVDPKARNELRDLLAAAMDDWIASGPSDAGDRLLVVFIDDLDRCEPDAVFQVFEAIKLYLDARGFVFVIAYDDAVVSESILRQKQYSKTITSRTYLEKIVQIEYRIPRPTDQQVWALSTLYTRESGTDAVLFDSALALVVERNSNPRRLKRFINSFVLEHQLGRDEELEPSALIRTLVLRYSFPEFFQLFFTGTDDPIREFLGYLEVKALLRDHDPAQPYDPVVVAYFEEHDVGLEGPTPLAGLEQRLPEIFPPLASNRNFVDLGRELESKAASADVRSRFESYPESGGPEQGGRAVAEHLQAMQPQPDLIDLRLLWIDDRPRDNSAAVDAIERLGGTVLTAQSGEEAARLLARSTIPCDLLISDVTREGDPERGFTELEELRATGVWSGPVVFYTARVTPARRERAAMLDAIVTTNAEELVHELLKVPTGLSRAFNRAPAS